MPTRAEAAIVERFTDRYRGCCAEPVLDMELEVLGTDYGSTGYTTREQADELATRLHLAPGQWLADIGAGAGWPGLYLAATTGCRVVATDLPLIGLRRAQERARRDGLGARTGFLVATGARQPLRPGSFDAVVHTDVMCCLGPKLTVLRACQRLLRPGGRLAFTTIHVAPGLDDRQRRRARRAGPVGVATRAEYPTLIARAGFADIVQVDLTSDYATTERVWSKVAEQRAEAMRRLTSDAEFAESQANRRLASDAITAGLRRRSLFTARHPLTTPTTGPRSLGRDTDRYDIVHTVALLLERCRPGSALATRPEDEQDTVIAGLLHRLWITPEPGHSFPSLQGMCAAWADELDAERAADRVAQPARLLRPTAAHVSFG
jgi:cyclopropane fatty-acyl-phospholipid synthase-like methyltransferase